MSKHFEKGAQVSWAWGAHRARGKVEARFERKVQRRFKGAKVIRKATPEEPAYVIRQDDGDKVLKSQSELRAL